MVQSIEMDPQGSVRALRTSGDTRRRGHFAPHEDAVMQAIDSFVSTASPFVQAGQAVPADLVFKNSLIVEKQFEQAVIAVGGDYTKFSSEFSIRKDLFNKLKAELDLLNGAERSAILKNAKPTTQSADYSLSAVFRDPKSHIANHGLMQQDTGPARRVTPLAAENSQPGEHPWNARVRSELAEMFLGRVEFPDVDAMDDAIENADLRSVEYLPTMR